MKVFGGILLVLLASFVSFWVWTEVKHDKSAIEYIQDEIQEHKDEKNATDDVTVENEDGEVQATASINF